MSALPPLIATDAHDQYVVNYGKSGAVGVFTAETPLALRRGQEVVIQSPRGIEIGAVMCVATLHQARLLGAVSAGPLLRPLNHEDEAARAELAAREQALFETSRAWALRDGRALEILDVELLFDGRQAVLQFVGEEADTGAFAQALELHFGLTIRLENLAAPRPHDEAEHGCGKPDCGRSAGGGCDTCSSGGGCSSCGSGKVDMRQYFGHLRDKMEAQHRIPLT
jgi:hypothetical protein